MQYYEINEQTARAAHEMMSMRDYPENRATNEYRAAVDRAAVLVQNKKAHTSAYYHQKLDGLLDAYARCLANWTNDYHKNGASCPSVLICGAGNFPVRKKERQIARERTLQHERAEIEGLLDKIRSTGAGAVDLNDPDARAQLTSELEAQTQLRENAKAANAYWRKHKTLIGCPALSPETAEKLDRELKTVGSFTQLCGKPFADYELSSLRNKIKRLKERIAQLDKLQAEQEQPAAVTKFNGGKIVRNAEQNRLQILFDEVPAPDMRQALKQNGFRWSPRNQAWQRQLTENAERAAKKLLSIM